MVGWLALLPVHVCIMYLLRIHCKRYFEIL
nr:MAG TPA: hypothetical protein [Caudoviricetes sp.]